MKNIKLSAEKRCDVLVIGSGIAGINAAVSAKENGSSVILVSEGRLFSGSSFYPGTWGLGLIGPENKKDIPDLINSIETVGCGMAVHEIVEEFVSGIHPAVERVRQRGVTLRTANQKNQKEFIPCFDHKHRDWNGLEFNSVKQIFGNLISELNITVLENHEVIRLAYEDGSTCGGIFFDGVNLKYISSKAVVLATGGYGSLFRYHLCTEDVRGTGQALALDLGCELINMEFMQMMPGYIYPAPKTVFNEKAFRYTSITKPDGTALLPAEQLQQVLEVRSGHGPFTSRLISKDVDIEIFKVFTEDEAGVTIAYSDEIRNNPPEFITTYFDWLKEAKHLTTYDLIHVGIFAHAANGGIRIGKDASTGVAGLFAAGEATGGMHGADRIGGLSTANGLVFGAKAGLSASEYAAKGFRQKESAIISAKGCSEHTFTSDLQNTMFKHAMIIRTDAGLRMGLQDVEQIKEALSAVTEETENAAAIASYRRMVLRLETAESILKAAMLRTESRGAHYRADYPQLDPKQNTRIVINKANGIHAQYEQLI